MDFTGRTVLVTGASRGIGRAVARRFGALGATLLLHYCASREAAESLLGELPAGAHAALQADLADAEAIRCLAAEAAAVTGCLDVLVNNAGVYLAHPIADCDEDTWEAAWRETLDVNLVAPARLCYHVGRQMITQGGGRIVNVSSRGAFRGEPEGPAYGASKAGLNALGQSLAQALGPHGVYVFTVAPGFVATGMAAPMLAGKEGAAIKAQSPLNRVAEPEEIANAVVSLAVDGNEWLTGCILDANGASYLRS
jgi:NAD(P)-dependent dehydrogenase (short-subunit alcohol dehydrogenase family)